MRQISQMQNCSNRSVPKKPFSELFYICDLHSHKESVESKQYLCPLFIKKDKLKLSLETFSYRNFALEAFPCRNLSLEAFPCRN